MDKENCRFMQSQSYYCTLMEITEEKSRSIYFFLHTKQNKTKQKIGKENRDNKMSVMVYGKLKIDS